MSPETLAWLDLFINGALPLGMLAALFVFLTGSAVLSPAEEVSLG